MHFYCSFSYLIYTIYLTRDVIFVSLQYAFFCIVISDKCRQLVYIRLGLTKFHNYWNYKTTVWDSKPVFLKRNLINLQLFLFPYGFSSRQIYQNNAYRLNDNIQYGERTEWVNQNPHIWWPITFCEVNP